MSSQNKDFWMSKAPVGDGDIAYNDSSRSEPKRSYHWFMDDTEAELFLNKKQAVDVPYPNSFTELLNSNICPSGNTSGFHSVTGQFMERLFDNETAQTTNFGDRNLASLGLCNTSMGRKVVEDQFGNDSSPVVSSLQNPRSSITYGGIKKFKVDHVKDAENFVCASLEHDFSTGDNAYSKGDDDSITTGLAFDRGQDSMVLMADTFNMIGSNFMSIDRSCNKEDTNEGYRENNGTISIRPSVSKDDSSITTMTPSFTKEDENYIAMGAFDEQSNDLLMDHVFNNDGNSVASVAKTFEGVCNTIPMVKTDSSGLTMRQSFSKGENNIISFGGLYDDEDNVDPSGRLVCSYDFSMGQPSVRRLEELSEKGMSEFTNDALVGGVQVTLGDNTVSKRKEDQKGTKKASPNNFPSNVRSLLSTGMLDGVPVKYVALSREKELRGVIKGSAILCGCQSCTFSKAINAYEFERHAGCKTKHPNNHIYFENGKTIYGVVQRLRNTPQNFLFEVIQTITGSPINQKSFRIWKESFLAATNELQQIYGNEEGKFVS